ncbi:hypothetical protein LP419_06520 [Massilia sp. H-1]|nr:hypothetical protein LP419_06520 [Massilia sp. H-1]
MQAAVSSGTPASLALVGQRTGLAGVPAAGAHRRQAAVRCLPCCHRLPPKHAGGRTAQAAIRRAVAAAG